MNDRMKGVRHFKDLKEAMEYVKVRYGIKMIFYPESKLEKSYYRGQNYGKKLYARADGQEWADSHEIIEIRNIEDHNIIEFIAFGDGYTYAYRYSREYDYINDGYVYPCLD